MRSYHSIPKPAIRSLLDHALHLHHLGFHVVPLFNKIAVRKWGRYQNKQPTEQTVRKWFSSPGVNGVAIITGTGIPGLCTMDWDAKSGHPGFAEKNPELAKQLPTWRTHRGHGAMFLSPLAKTIAVPRVGEFRGGKTLTILPPSLHPRGGRYVWTIPLVDEKQLVEVDPALFVPEELLQRKLKSSAARVSEDSDGVSEPSEPLCSPLNTSETLSADQIIQQTLPTEPGQRHTCLLKLARGLKFNFGQSTPAERMQILRRWHRLALPAIDTKDFEVSRVRFDEAFESAKFPLGFNAVDAAASRVDPSELPPACHNYESEAVHRLICLCAELAKISAPSGVFFLSSHDAGRRLGVPQMMAYRYLRMLCSDGVLQLVENGNQHRASRYRYIQPISQE